MRRHLVETALGTMHLRTHGGGDRTPLVLLHMSPQTSEQHHLIAPLLGTDRLVVMPDRIGYGDSDPLPRGPFTLEQVAAATLEAVTALGVDRFDVFGIHTGSSEAIELAACTAPDRVRRASVVAVPAFSEEELAVFRPLFREPPPPADDGRLLRWLWRYSTGQYQPQIGREGWGAEQVHAQIVKHLKAWPESWRMFHCVFDYPVAERVGLVRQPLLVLTPNDEIREITLRTQPQFPPQARLLELPHMDFEVLELNAPEIAGHLRAFLDAPEGAAGPA
jgi:pimeloyl-ACP methyl ester carboxylesterase